MVNAYLVAGVSASFSLRLQANALAFNQRHWQLRRGVKTIGISAELRCILPIGTTGRLNSMTTCLPGGTSAPSGVMRMMRSSLGWGLDWEGLSSVALNGEALGWGVSAGLGEEVVLSANK